MNHWYGRGPGARSQVSRQRAPAPAPSDGSPAAIGPPARQGGPPAGGDQHARGGLPQARERAHRQAPSRERTPPAQGGPVGGLGGTGGTPGARRTPTSPPRRRSAVDRAPPGGCGCRSRRRAPGDDAAAGAGPVGRSPRSPRAGPAPDLRVRRPGPRAGGRGVPGRCVEGGHASRRRRGPRAPAGAGPPAGRPGPPGPPGRRAPVAPARPSRPPRRLLRPAGAPRRVAAPARPSRPRPPGRPVRRRPAPRRASLALPLRPAPRRRLVSPASPRPPAPGRPARPPRRHMPLTRHSAPARPRPRLPLTAPRSRAPPTAPAPPPRERTSCSPGSTRGRDEPLRARACVVVAVASAGRLRQGAPAQPAGCWPAALAAALLQLVTDWPFRTDFWRTTRHRQRAELGAAARGRLPGLRPELREQELLDERSRQRASGHRRQAGPRRRGPGPALRTDPVASVGRYTDRGPLRWLRQHPERSCSG